MTMFCSCEDNGNLQFKFIFNCKIKADCLLQSISFHRHPQTDSAYLISAFCKSIFHSKVFGDKTLDQF